MTFLSLALALLLQDGWEYKGVSKTFVHSATMEQKSPDELFAHGEKLFQQRDYTGAARVFHAIATSLPSESAGFRPLREKALFAVARCYYAAGDFAGAYQSFEYFLAKFADSELAGGTYGGRWYLFASAMNLVRVGTQETFLGVPVYRSSKGGVTLLREALLRYPREAFSDDFYLQLGDYFVEQGQLEEAETEYKFILTPGQYDKSNSAPRAQLNLARIYLKRFDGIDYDVKTLADARREYEKFLSSWSRAVNDPKMLAELELDEARLQKMIAEATHGIAQINDKLAEKEWRLAEYYLWKGKPNAAKIYLNSIRNNYPRTEWAGKAQKKLDELK